MSESQRLGVQYTVLDPLPDAQVDQALLLRVRVTNTGAVAWSNRGAYPVNVSYHWYDTNGQVVDFEGIRAVLPRQLRPGESAEVTMQVEPPPRPGSYHLVLDMVEEGVNWFVIQGVPGHHIPITVAPSSNKPRVCIINGNVMANDAVGNHVVNQLRFFQEHGYNAMVLVEHVDDRLPADVRRNIARATLTELRDGTKNPQFRRGVRHFQSADLYVVHYSTFYALAEAIRLIDHGVVIFDYHGVTPPHLWEGPGVETLIEGVRRLDLVRYADYAIGHSAFTCGELVRTGAIAPDRVFQMGYVVSLDRFAPGAKAATLLERHALRPDQPVLLYVGRMAGNKRIIDLVRALPLIRQQVPDTVLLLVGDTQFPSYAQNVAQARREAEALGVTDAMIFAGVVPDAELPEYYRLADLFVTASLHEGFCIPAIESMASGVPVIGARATALPETIGAGGLTFTPEDATDLADTVVKALTKV